MTQTGSVNCLGLAGMSITEKETEFNLQPPPPLCGFAFPIQPLATCQILNYGNRHEVGF